jgi:hypothetical protein
MDFVENISIKKELDEWKGFFEVYYPLHDSSMGGLVGYPVQINIRVQYYFTKICVIRNRLEEWLGDENSHVKVGASKRLKVVMGTEFEELKDDSQQIHCLLNDYLVRTPGFEYTAPGYIHCIYTVGLFICAVSYKEGAVRDGEIYVKALSLLETKFSVTKLQYNKKLRECFDRPESSLKEMMVAVESIVDLYSL